MARQTAISINTIPIGPLGIIGMPGCEELTDKIDKYLVKWRKTQASEHAESIAFFGYQRDTYKIDVSIPRFGSGEGKGVINESVRGYDIYIVCDVFNYSCSYDMYGRKVYMSPTIISLTLRELFQRFVQNQKEFLLLCLCFTRADSTREVQENHLTVQWLLRSSFILVLKTLLRLTLTTKEYKMQFLTNH